jgi:uncharacterized protein (DUF2235 family)
MALYAFDGTDDDDSHAGTSWEDVAADTNVFRFYSAYTGYARSSDIQTSYVPGVGTRFGLIGRVAGSAWGVGWLPRVNENYDALCKNYVAGDHEIDVIGFSRGSAIALDFVNKVNRDGIQSQGKTVVEHPPIRFVGLFDTVAAFGVANLGFFFASLNAFHQLTLPPNVQHCYHAMSLDERRPSFVNQRVAGAYEVWFRGVHSDIGGGNNNPGLEYVALRWMFRKAILCGLPVTEANITDSAIHPEARIEPSFFSDVSTLTWRKVKVTDTVHYGVGQHPVLEDEPCNAVPQTCSIETLDFEKTRIALPAAATT